MNSEIKSPSEIMLMPAQIAMASMSYGFAIFMANYMYYGIWFLPSVYLFFAWLLMKKKKKAT